MPSYANRRKSTRIPVSVPAEILLKRNTNPVKAEIIDISIGGAFIHCTAPITIGQEVFVQIYFEKTQILEAKVVELPIKNELAHLPRPTPEKSIIRWVRGSSKTGFGVEFIDLREDKSRFLARLVTHFNALTAKPRAGVSKQAPPRKKVNPAKKSAAKKKKKSSRPVKRKAKARAKKR